MNIVIRKAKSSDVQDIQSVLYLTWLATYPNKEIGITKEDIEERFKNRNSVEVIEKMKMKVEEGGGTSQLFVALADGAVVGVCGVAVRDECNQLQTIHVLPEFQNKGIGKILWHEAQSVFDIEKQTQVEVAEYNTSAIRFYEHLGFVKTGKKLEQEKLRMPISGVIIPEVEMKRE